jgi:hypothetical protein
MQTFKIIWPERKNVTASQIEIWYDDAVANKEVEDVDCVTPADKAAELNHAGLITLGR